MRVGECMTREVRTVRPDQTLEDAARIMGQIDAGAVPVGDDERLMGMLTDRDIAVRGVACGKSSNALVQEVMSPEVMYCFEDDDAQQVLENMGDIQVRRLPVLDRDKRLVGIVSLSDLARDGHAAPTGQALSQIARPGGQHSQSLH